VTGPGEMTATELRSCCAAAYEDDLVALVLGPSYHPGGADLTRRLARTLDLRPGDRVLDVASGPGTTARLLAEEFGVTVDGIDASARSAGRARADTARRSLDGKVRFLCGDAQALPFADAGFDAVICECSFCTFPDRPAAAAEFARVLRPGGRVGITDVTVEPERLEPRLQTLAARVACLADARPAGAYEAILAGAGLRVSRTEAHDDALARMIDQVDARLRALEVAGLPGVDLSAARPYLAAAAAAVADGTAGYVLLAAVKA
jgi:arsenite methyltransferase